MEGIYRVIYRGIKLSTAVVILIMVIANSVYGDEPVYRLDIPADKASSSLDQLAEKTKHSLFYLTDDLTRVTTNSLDGLYTLPEALDVLLKGTPLNAVVTEKGVIVVSVALIDQQHNSAEGNNMSSSQKKTSIFAGIVAAFASAFSGSHAAGQEVGDNRAGENFPQKGGIEEVVVTAQKRGAVNVQDFAGSIQAFSAQQLDNDYVEGFNDYFNRVPSLSAVNQGSGQTQIVFRGVTSGRVLHSEPQNRATAGIYIDETVVTNNAFNPDVGMFDLNRVEVLRGPQGTLYGASSMSGAIRIITNEPNVNEFESKVDLTLSNTDEGGLNNSEKFMVNIPVVEDSLGIRAVGYRVDRSGYVDNVVNGKEDINDEESYGGRLSALWLASDRLSIRGTVNYHSLDSDGRPDEYLPNDSFLMLATGFSVTDELQTSKFLDETFDDEFTLSNLTVKYELDNHEVVSSTSYLDREFTNTLDDSIRVQFFFGPGLIANFKTGTEIEDFTQEIRIASTHDRSLNYVVGLFYQDQEKSYGGSEVVPGSDAFFTSIGIPPAAFFGASPDSIADVGEEISTEQIAIFGEIVWQISDQWELTAGLRAFDWSSEADIFSAGLVDAGFKQRSGEADETGLSPKLNLTYRASDDVLIYGVASKGFRIGGVNGPINRSLCGPDLNAIGGGDTPEAFDSDELWNYEIGAKTSWMDNSLYINVSGYKIEWKDIQSQVLLPTCGFFFKDNSGDVDIWGMEVEIIAAPTDNLDLYFTASWTDGELVSDPNTLGVSTFGADGDRVPNVPKFQASASLSYQWPGAFEGFDAFLRASMQYAGSSYSQFNDDASAINFPKTPKVPSYFSGDISFGIESEAWQLSLFVKNVTDEEIVTAVDTDRLQPTTNSRARPRTVGLNIRKQW